MNQINSVCVYSASSTKIDAVYFQAAETLGRLLAEHHIRLINGAGSIGLMCSVADAVLKNGGEVTGVIPRFMVEQNWHHTGLTELIEVESMHERKQKMANLSDGIAGWMRYPLRIAGNYHLETIGVVSQSDYNSQYKQIF